MEAGGRQGGSIDQGVARDSDDEVWMSLENERSFLRKAARALPRKVDPGVSASDLVQEALVDAKRWAPSFRGAGRAAWRRWLLTVLRTRASRSNRRARGIAVPIDAHPEFCPAGHESSPSRAAAKRERARALAAALRGLEPKDRELLRLRHQESLNYQAIAWRMGLVSSEAVRKRHLRALNRLRAVLGPAHEPA